MKRSKEKRVELIAIVAVCILFFPIAIVMLVGMLLGEAFYRAMEMLDDRDN
jgi:nitrate reductase NapE component